MNLKALSLLSLAILSGCNSSSTPVKENNFQIKMTEDESYVVNLFEYFDQPMKTVSFSLSSENIVAPKFDVAKNNIELTPFKDINGDVKLIVNGEDANGTQRRFNYDVKVNPVADSPNFSNNNVRIEYNKAEKFDSGIRLVDVDSNIEDVLVNVTKNNDDISLVIEGDKIFLIPKVLGVNKNINYQVEFTDGDDVFYQDLNIEVEYITGQIPLTEDSLTNITILEDVNYIGKMEPQKIYEAQEFEITYDTSGLLGQLIQKENYTYEYIPVLNYNGIDKFKVTIKNSDGDVVTREIKITIVSDIDDLFVSDINHVMEEDSVALLPMSIIDPELQRNYNFSVISGLNNGQIEFTGTNLRYTPNKDFFGTENIVINLLDSLNNRSVNFNLNVNVISSLDPLAIEDKEITILRGHNYSEMFSFYDAENGEFSFAISNPTEGRTSINQDGTYNYESLNAGTAAQDSFIIYVLDSENRRTDDVTITINILDNSSPNQVIELNEDEVTNQILVAGVVSGQESDYTVQIVDNPSNGTLTLNSNNTFNYKGFSNVNGTDNFAFNVLDRTTGLSYRINYTAIIRPVIDELDITKINKSLSILEDETLTYNVSKLDVDQTGTSNYQMITNASNGNVSIDQNTGILTYNPSSNFNGEDSFSVRATKSDSNDSLIVDFSVRVLAGEDPLYLTSPIEIKMYGNSKYTLNIKDLVVNEDPEEFIFIGDTLIDSTMWSINTGGIPVFDITLDALTGELIVIDKGLLSKGDTRDYTFSIREVDSGTVRDFNINIEILDEMHIMPNPLSLEDNRADVFAKYNLMLCPGEFTLAAVNLELLNGMNIYGSQNNLAENDSNLDVLHNCPVKEGASIISVPDLGSLILVSNTSLNGVTVTTKGANEKPIILKTSSDNIEFVNTEFRAEIAPPNNASAFISGETAINNLIIRDSKFIGFEAVVNDPRAAIHVNESVNKLTISNNNFEKVAKGIVIDSFVTWGASILDSEATINDNTFTHTDDSINVKAVFLPLNSLIMNIVDNTINDSLNSIAVGQTNRETNGIVNLNIERNRISNAKNGINVNESGISLKNTNLLIKDNEMEVKEEFGIKVSDQILTSASFSESIKEVEITDNSIMMSNSTISEENSGIMINVDYFDLFIDSRDAGFDVNMQSSSTLSLEISNNTIGDNTSPFKFNKYGIGIFKTDYDYNVVGSENYHLNATINNNSVYGRNDFAIDDSASNSNKYDVNLNMTSNNFRSEYPVPSMLLKENYTDLCVYFNNNTVDVIEMYNDDPNSTLTIADIDEEEELVIFNNNTVGNALFSNVTYAQINKCH